MGSYRRRARPRPGFINRIIYIIKRIVSDAIQYVKRNPTKVLLPIVMALVSGGGLAAMAAKLGVQLPGALGSGGGLGRGMQSGLDAFGRYSGGTGGGGMVKNLMAFASEFL